MGWRVNSLASTPTFFFLTPAFRKVPTAVVVVVSIMNFFYVLINYVAKLTVSCVLQVMRLKMEEIKAQMEDKVMMLYFIKSFFKLLIFIQKINNY